MQKKIGIWGYGTTGKSAVQYFGNSDYSIQIMDAQQIPHHELEELRKKNISFINQNCVEQFFEHNDTILVSPGIDIRPYAAYNHKLLNELDIFYKNFKKPIIAITGSIGKTTITHLISQLLVQAGKRVLTGGNIGTPMLDLLKEKDACDIAVLEVSSFQLEYCKEFAPDLAIITNIYPNHLDRHASYEEYCKAKFNIFTYQNENQQVLMRKCPCQSTESHQPSDGSQNLNSQALNSFSQKENINEYNKQDCSLNKINDSLCICTSIPLARKNIHYFSSQNYNQVQNINNNCRFFYFYNDVLYVNDTKLMPRNQLPTNTFEENWIIICAAFTLLNIPLPALSTSSMQLPEHRLEKVDCIHGIDFYNDSKSTTPQSTLAAVQRLQQQPIHLLLGGLSKGIDRSLLIDQLAGKVKKIYCFGKESEQLHAWCQEKKIPSASYSTLDQALKECYTQSTAHDQILFSPAGSSFDLFRNYIERGNYFKKLVQDLKQNN